MKNDKAHCPYCGQEMYDCDDGQTHWCFCPVCNASSPDAHTEEEAHEKAKMRFEPMRKPLTMEDLRREIYKIPCYVEFNERNSMLHPTVLNRDSSVWWTEDKGESIHLYSEEYNKTWRCWKDVPSCEERAAAKWED